MRHKVGDRVKIKSIDWYKDNMDDNGYIFFGHHMFDEDMSKLCGKTMTISYITQYGVIAMVENEYYWTEEMIACKIIEVEENEYNKNN